VERSAAKKYGTHSLCSFMSAKVSKDHKNNETQWNNLSAGSDLVSLLCDSMHNVSIRRPKRLFHCSCDMQ